jgi:hypothetical protein
VAFFLDHENVYVLEPIHALLTRSPISNLMSPDTSGIRHRAATLKISDSHFEHRDLRAEKHRAVGFNLCGTPAQGSAGRATHRHPVVGNQVPQRLSVAGKYRGS